jgi:uncharacterized protein YndB with AHSA1/START domain
MKPGIQPRSRLRSIRVFRRYSAPPERVFGAWLDPEVAGRWLFATAFRPAARVEIDPRAGGSFRFVDRRDGDEVEYSGDYLEIISPRRLAFTLSTSDIPRAVTRVGVEFVPLAAGCEIILTHEDLPPERADRAEARWTGILYGLAETLAHSHPHPTLPHQGGGKETLLSPSRGNEGSHPRRNDEIPVPDLR